MTRHGRTVHMVFSQQSRLTGRPAPVPMMRASSTTNMFPPTWKAFATPLENISGDPPGLTMVVAIARLPEAPIQKTSFLSKCRPRVLA